MPRLPHPAVALVLDAVPDAQGICYFLFHHQLLFVLPLLVLPQSFLVQLHLLLMQPTPHHALPHAHHRPVPQAHRSRGLCLFGLGVRLVQDDGFRQLAHPSIVALAVLHALGPSCLPLLETVLRFEEMLRFQLLFPLEFLRLLLLVVLHQGFALVLMVADVADEFALLLREQLRMLCLVLFDSVLVVEMQLVLVLLHRRLDSFLDVIVPAQQLLLRQFPELLTAPFHGLLPAQ